MIALLPKAAEAYRRQITQGLANDHRAAGKARVILRKLLGNIRLVIEQSGLWAEFDLQPAALLRAVGSDGSGAEFDCSLLLSATLDGPPSPNLPGSASGEASTISSHWCRFSG